MRRIPGEEVVTGERHRHDSIPGEAALGGYLALRWDWASGPEVNRR